MGGEKVFLPETACGVDIKELFHKFEAVPAQQELASKAHRCRDLYSMSVA